MPVGSGLPRCGVGFGRGEDFEELKRRKLRKGRRRRSRYEVCHVRKGADRVAERAVKYVRERVLLIGFWRRGVCLVRVLRDAAWMTDSCKDFWRSSCAMRDEMNIKIVGAPTRNSYLW